MMGHLAWCIVLAVLVGINPTTLTLGIFATKIESVISTSI
jgi:hypothetical protein